MIPQNLNQRDEIKSLGHTIARHLHAAAITVEDRDFELLVAVVAVKMGVPADVVEFVAIDAAIWSQHILDSIEMELQED